jgi:hypothetical protein
MERLRLFRERAGWTWNQQVTRRRVAMRLTPFCSQLQDSGDGWIAEIVSNQRRIPRRTTPPYHRAILNSEQVEQAPISEAQGCRA